MLTLSGLDAGYGRLTVVRGIDLTVDEGQAICIIGNNGAGKTTIIRAIFGLLNQRRGRIEYEGVDLLKTPSHRLVDLGIGLVPEGRRVFRNLSVRENLELGLRPRSLATGGRDVMAEVLDFLPELTRKLRTPAGLLSGGEQQMLAMGRALCTRPKLLILDEPSMGLAPIVVDRIYVLLAELRTHALSILLVEQDVGHALSIADHGYLIEAGRVAASAPAEDLMGSADILSSYLGGDEGD